MKRMAAAMGAVLLVAVGVAVGATTATRFSDVSEDHYAAEAIEWAAAAGIVVGKGDGTFDPTGKLNRAQLVTILYRYHQVFGDAVPAHSHTSVPAHTHTGTDGSHSHSCTLQENFHSRIFGGVETDQSSPGSSYDRHRHRIDLDDLLRAVTVEC